MRDIYHRTTHTVLVELFATLIDTARYGDLRGHLAAWWQVATGRITGDTTI